MAAEEHVEIEENCEKTLKRKREPSVLDNFTKLTNPQEKLRVKSGVDLLKHLCNENSEKNDDELKYALGRLIRGLGSSNIYAKSGFFAALVGLLNLKTLSVTEIFEHVTKELHKGGSNSKSENADICSGQILICGAILRSNLYETCDDADKTKVLQLLVNAGKERTYLTLAAYKFLCDLFEKVSAKEFEKIVFPIVKSELGKPWPEHNLDNLYLLLEIEKNFPQSLHQKFLKNNLGTSEILCGESLHHICNVLMSLPRLTALNHPIYDLIITKIAETDLTEQFFNELDRTLTRSNRNKFFVFTKLLTGILNNLTDSTIIPDILTKNYIQQLISTYKTAVGKQKDKQFKDITQKLFEVLLESLKKEHVKSKTKIKVLKRLLFFPGTFVFEKVTKNRLIQNITAVLNSEGVKKLGGIYREVILGVEDKVINENLKERWWNVDRVYASHLLVKLVNHSSMHEENEWKIEQLIFLGKLGLLRSGSENVGNELAESLKETFYSSLDLKLTKLNDLRLILSKVVEEFDENIDDLRDPLNEENLQIWKKTVELSKKLASSKKKNAILPVFHTLFLNLALQIFDNSKLASDSLRELFSCYERSKKKKNEETSSDDPLWIEVVVDLFLNLLSHNSHLLRNVINCVFPHLCEYMNPTAIHQILSILDPKNESILVNKNEEESEEEEEDDEDDDDDDDEEEEELEEEEDEEENHVNDKLRMALHQVLSTGAESEAESIDLDELDEEEGEKLDAALAQAFKQFKPNLGKNKKQKKDDEALTHFRIRVLDLVEIYLNSTPSMLLTLEIMLPLLQLLEFCIKDDHQKPLEARVKANLKKLSSLKKFGDHDGVTEEVLVDLLKSLLEKGTRNAVVIQEMGEKIADCSIFVINCSQVLNKNSVKIKEVIREGLEAFFARRDCIIPYVLFKNLVQMNWEGVLDLISLLTGFVFSTNVRPFRRNQALELLKLFSHNQRLISGNLDKTQTVDDDVISFLKDCIDFFREFSNDPSQRKVKEKFFCNLFELITSIKGSLLAKNFNDWETLSETVRDCRSNLSFSRDTKVAFNKLCKSLNISNIVQMKKDLVKLSNADVEVEETKEVKKKKVNGELKKEKKKKVSKEKLKLKKQTKELRLGSLSEGLSKRKFELEEENEEDNKKAKLS